MPTEQMLCNVGIESITGEFLLTTQYFEIFFPDDQMQKAAHTTDRAIAFRDLQIVWRIYLESDTAAMTASAMNRHLP